MSEISSTSRIENALAAYAELERAKKERPADAEIVAERALQQVHEMPREEQIEALRSIDASKHPGAALDRLARDLQIRPEDLNSVGAHAYGGGAEAKATAPRMSSGATFDPRKKQTVEELFEAAVDLANAKGHSVQDALEHVTRENLGDILADVEAAKAQQLEMAELMRAKSGERVSRVAVIDQNIAHQKYQLQSAERLLENQRSRVELRKSDKFTDQDRAQLAGAIRKTEAEIGGIHEAIAKLEAQRSAAEQHDAQAPAMDERLIGAMADTRLDDYLAEKLKGVEASGELPLHVQALVQRRYGNYDGWYRGLTPKRRAELDRVLDGEEPHVSSYVRKGTPTSDFAALAEAVKGVDETNLEGSKERFEEALAHAAGNPPEPTQAANQSTVDQRPADGEGAKAKAVDGVEGPQRRTESKNDDPENRDAALARAHRDQFEALHADDAHDFYHALWALAKSPDAFDKKAAELGWNDAQRDDYRAKASQILDREYEGVNGNTYTVRDAFSFDSLLRDSKNLMPGRASSSINEADRSESELRMAIRIWSAQNLLGRKMEDATFNEKVRAKVANLRAKSSTERSQVRELYGIADVNPRRAQLSPEKQEILNRHPDFKTAYEQHRRKEEQFETTSATTLAQIGSLLNSGMPIDKLIVAVMFLMTMREEEKFKRTLAEVGVIEQIERTNAEIAEKKEALEKHYDLQKTDPTKDSDLSLLEVQEYEKLEYINPVDFGFSAKSHHMLTQELQASLQFFQQMMQALSQTLSVWQGLVDSILSRWR